ncbi:MAG: endonuclease/exonuclease/phosphatase family protein, partial [Gemmatimonadetes bacterium]|nr:endonuclease/exonuclease/phosphatase family protein [Gemmatimonadota bacterium]
FPDAGARGVTVLTRNLYLGADVDPIIGAQSLAQIPGLAGAAWATIQATDFPARAQALADEIAATRPHLVGLQEVTLYRVQTPSDAIVGGAAPATVVAYDFLEILLDALAARGLDYEAVASVTLTDVEVPAFTGAPPIGFQDIRYTDREVILARGDVAAGNPQGAPYAADLDLNLGGVVPIELKRGWVAVDAQLAGNTVRFVSTHLEVQAFAPIQVAQANELIALLADSPFPVILLGDFNSAADGSQTPTYANLSAAGYVDVWNRSHPNDPGYTCCHVEDLSNQTPALTQRLDIVFVRDAFTVASAGLVGGAQTVILGDEPEDRTASGLWPSDHAGVAANLQLPPAFASN